MLVLVRCVYDDRPRWHEHELDHSLALVGMIAIGENDANSREIYA